jgi:hypothetical protein
LAALAVTIKIAALLPALALVVWLFRRHGWRAGAAAGGTIGGLVAAAYAIVGGRAALQPLIRAAGYVSRASVWRELPLHLRQPDSRLVLLVLLVAVPATIATVARLGGTPASAAAAGVMPYLLAGPDVLPWYFAWALPLAALGDDTALAGVLFAETILVEMAYTYRVVPHPDGLDRLLRAVTPATQIFECAALAALVLGGSVVMLRQLRARQAGELA